MRHKYLILGLSVILIALVVIKVYYEPLFFPMQIDFEERIQWSQKKVDKLIKKRTSQKFADIPWDEFSIGDDMEYIKINSKHTTDSTVVFNGNIIDANIVKFFSASGKLIEIDLYFEDPQLVKTDILSMYGNKYLKFDDSAAFVSYNDYESRFFWMRDSILVIYEIEDITYEFGYPSAGGYLTITDVSNLSDEELKSLILHGHISMYWKHKPLLQSFIEWYRTP